MRKSKWQVKRELDQQLKVKRRARKAEKEAHALAIEQRTDLQFDDALGRLEVALEEGRIASAELTEPAVPAEPEAEPQAQAVSLRGSTRLYFGGSSIPVTVDSWRARKP